ncbi:helix-turn-helix domain-containing protein [Microcystis wesenbergii FACHB-1317]|nr:helix-turn-helix domain-containing protein [Microcystis wesenbergii FACHB-1317]NCQ93655.1 helix-turn-helix domain-containing protein [Microcystis aeruginosa LG13-13]NCR06777.1 helix-turn-helix domain-containing protein [Microcystis aeruginosa LG13-03]NCR64965.1 helix-turn-helix domain-containing protein [Microcystis aeruginosa LG11-05]REJ55896.1 MAG: transposase [Microcystis aeruginosa TA09]
MEKAYRYRFYPTPAQDRTLGALLGLVGKMYSKIQSCWRSQRARYARPSGRNHSRHRGHKD